MSPMSKSSSSSPPPEAPTMEQSGPYSQVTTTRYEVSGITFTTTTTTEASHAPAPCGCHNSDPDPDAEQDAEQSTSARWAALVQILTSIAQKIGAAGYQA